MDNKEIKILHIDDVLPNRFQPRIQFDEKAINELAESIKVHGVIQPIVVRKISDKYEIIAGERRYKASVLAGKTNIPAIITTLDDRESAEIALIENVQRQNLTPIEEAISYKKILDMGYLNQITLGEKLGKTQSTIANKLRLLNLNDNVQEALMENKISERHARSLLRLTSDMQIMMLNRIIAERLTVRKTDEEIEKLLIDNPKKIKSSSEPVKEMSENMNDETLYDLNIPSEPIIDTVEVPVMPTLETIDFDIPISVEKEEIIEPMISPEPLHINPTEEINPGFMNIEKIEEEAEDIYKQPEPIADLDRLMDTSNNPVINDTVSPMQNTDFIKPNTETTPADVPGGGKFFTMFTREEDQNPEFVKDIESKELNMDFQVPKIEETFNFTGFQNETIDTSVKQPTLLEPIIPAEPTVSLEPLPMEEQPLLEPDKLDNTMDFTQTFKPFSLNDDNSFINDTTFEQQPEPMVTVEPIAAPYPTIEPITYDEMGEIEVKLPSQQKLATADLKTVINTIRECAATIEHFGFTIDTEEIDLENKYLVTFTIDKQ